MANLKSGCALVHQSRGDAVHVTLFDVATEKVLGEWTDARADRAAVHDLCAKVGRTPTATIVERAIKGDVEWLLEAFPAATQRRLMWGGTPPELNAKGALKMLRTVSAQ